ncbi:hypothetical protein QR685DRAFT_168405 [Neurospora intermedia]|uniref:Secreted protein n=1 Tax=Neurospora intermedia TaxID=5142 RepID=A0ABR3DMV9_NEUIN
MPSRCTTPTAQWTLPLLATFLLSCSRHWCDTRQPCQATFSNRRHANPIKAFPVAQQDRPAVSAQLIPVLGSHGSFPPVVHPVVSPPQTPILRSQCTTTSISAVPQPIRRHVESHLVF